MLSGVQRLWGHEPSHSQGNSHVGNCNPKTIPKFLERNYRGQNPFPWGVFYIIGKILKCKCLKWAHIAHLDIWNTKKGWLKERLGVKVAVWLPTTKSWESTRFPCVQATRNIPLKSSWRGLQLCFRPHCDRRFAQEVMRPQSRGNPSCENFGTPTWESRDKKPFGCGPVESCKVYYKGEGDGFPQV
jgi:hypothetical protein